MENTLGNTRTFHLSYLELRRAIGILGITLPIVLHWVHWYFFRLVFRTQSAAITIQGCEMCLLGLLEQSVYFCSPIKVTNVWMTLQAIWLAYLPLGSLSFQPWLTMQPQIVPASLGMFIWLSQHYSSWPSSTSLYSYLREPIQINGPQRENY